MTVITNSVTAIYPKYNPTQDLIEAQMLINETEKHRKIDAIVNMLNKENATYRLPSVDADKNG